MDKIEPTQDNLNRYLMLLQKHNFRFRSSDDPRFLERGYEEEYEIALLRDVFDADNKIYNVYSPYPRK